MPKKAHNAVIKVHRMLKKTRWENRKYIAHICLTFREFSQLVIQIKNQLKPVIKKCNAIIQILKPIQCNYGNVVAAYTLSRFSQALGLKNGLRCNSTVWVFNLPALHSSLRASSLFMRKKNGCRPNSMYENCIALFITNECLIQRIMTAIRKTKILIIVVFFFYGKHV